MKEIFKLIFKKYNLTDEELGNCIKDYTTGLIVTLVSNMQNLTKDDEIKIEQMVKVGDSEGIIKLLESKFESKEAWELYAESHAVPLMASYIKAVVK